MPMVFISIISIWFFFESACIFLSPLRIMSYLFWSPFHVFSDVYISRHKSPIFFILHSLGQFISMPCVEVFESEFTYPQQAGLSMESLCFGLQDDPPEDHFAFTTANALCVRISVYILISQLMSLTIWSWNLDPTARCYHEVPIFQRGKFSPKVIKVSKPSCSFLK